MSLPARYYIDSNYYEAERDWFFRDRWVHVGRVEDLPARGDFVLREIGRDSVIIVRGEDGEIAAYHNVCRHRGTRLTASPAGTFASTIQCPYHAWTFGLNGCLMGAPHMDTVEGFRLTDYPLFRVAVDVWDGLLFIHLGEKPALLADQIGSIKELFAPWGMERLRKGARIVYDVAANWKLIIHNYSECLHCPGVHPALQKLSHYLSGENEPAGAGFLGGRMRLRDGIGTMSFEGQMRRSCLPGLDESLCRYVYFYAILPNLLLSPHPDYVMTHRLVPLGVGRTEIICELLFDPNTLAAPDFNADGAIEFWDLTNRQDWHVCEEMQRGLASTAYRPGPYSPRESLLHDFDELILALEREKSGGVAHDRESR
jgi:Rieske 2Fe-2S family protein